MSCGKWIILLLFFINVSRYVLFGIGLEACSLAGNFEASRPLRDEPWLELGYRNETDIKAHTHFSTYFHVSPLPLQLTIEF